MRTFSILVFAFLLAITVIQVKGQQVAPINSGTVKGIIRDTVHNHVLKSATVSVYKAADSTLLSYQLSNIYGEFNFKKMPVNVALNIEISHVGYQRIYKKFTIPAISNLMDLKTLVINPRDITLKDVVISIPPISMNGDTLEFNAAAFKLDSNAVVEDLLRKIPNITLWGDGQITVNGREIKSVLVNGKPFFDGNVKIATQNIPKNALEKVQVYSTVTKDNPLDSILTINLKLKKGKDIGYFGKVGGGYGTNKRYETDVSLNVFSPKFELAIVGASNNINKSLSSVRQLLNNSTFKGVGTNVEYQPDFTQSGLNQSHGTGVLFTYNFIEKPSSERKSTLKSNYFMRHGNNDQLSETQKTTTINDKEQRIEKNTSKNNTINTSHNFDSNFDWNKNNQSLNISQNLTENQGRTNNETFRTAENAQNTLISTNNSISENQYKSSRINLRTQYSLFKDYRKINQLFNGFSAGYDINVEDNKNDRLNITEFKSFSDTASNQNFHRKYNTKSTGVNQGIDIKFPKLKSIIFGQKQLAGIDFSVSNHLKINSKNDNNRVQDLNELTHRYEDNAYLNNKVQSNIITETPGIDFEKSFHKSLSNRYNKNLSFLFSPKLQFIHQDYHSDKSFQNITRSYSRFAPNASISYNNYQYGDFTRTYNVIYETNVYIPSLQQLAPLTDSANQYYLQKGNLNLKEMIERSISFRFNHDDQTAKNTLNYNFNVKAGINNDKIVDSILIDNENRRTIYQVNADGNKFLNFYGEIRKEFKLKISAIQLMFSTYINAEKLPGYTNNVFSFSNTFNTRSNLTFYYTYKDLLALEAAQSYLTYASKQEAFQTEYSGNTKASTLSSSYNISKKLTLKSNVTFNSNSSSRTRSVNFTIWNASVVYRFLKGNNAEFKCAALDLLRQNNSVINYGNANSFTVGTQNVLEQYFMVTFSYYPRKFGKNLKK
ncbi:hypothetical protein QG516_04870 [Pedobacter gandavensis]|uniref:outer membrane beta-barrel protein n=1 Tax=Pedobacter gandavensis TaxID=2679963 RepID=UPI00247B03C9|nr:outer membrane beta-barrel protein [Pedobacter gandavensis]WGQ10985.1 hypothetical protein QG516_04870 [Pedobacter gandavensis]